MNKPPFLEDYYHPFAAPADHRSIAEFDWDDLTARLGETQTELSSRDYEDLIKALRTILKWIVGADLDRPEPERRIGRRTIALLWAMDPAMFKGNPSLTKVAKCLGISKATLSGVASSASRQFNLSNEYHVHNWRKKTRR